MARLLVLDDPAHARGNRARGMVVSVLADGASAGRMGDAQYLLVDVPGTVAQAQAVYLADGVPQAARDAEAAEEARYQSDVTAALAARAAELAAGSVTQEQILATVTPFDESLRVNPGAYPWRKKRLALGGLANAIPALAAARAALAATATSHEALRQEQAGSRSARRVALRGSIKTALLAEARSAREAGLVIDPDGPEAQEVREGVIRVVQAFEDLLRSAYLSLHAQTPVSLTLAQVQAGTVDA